MPTHHWNMNMSDAVASHLPATLRRDITVFGMWVFLATELMFFGVLFGSYIVLRTLYPQGFAEASRHTYVLLGTLNTAILLTSSLTMAMAVNANQNGARRATMNYLITTLELGLIFMVIKFLEYFYDYSEQLVPGIHFAYSGIHAHAVELFFYLYFVMTGFHALHLLIGIVLLAVLVWLIRQRPMAENASMIEVGGLYWHLIDLIWIFLYPMLYLIARS